MDQQSPEEEVIYEWKKMDLESNSNVRYQPYWAGDFVLLDHLIILGDDDIYTFHLKELYWTQFKLPRVAYVDDLTSDSCLVGPGLIACFVPPSNQEQKATTNDYGMEYYDWKPVERLQIAHVTFLTFDVKEGTLKNFCRESQEINGSWLPEFREEPVVTSDEDFLCVFVAGKGEDIRWNLVYRIYLGRQSDGSYSKERCWVSAVWISGNYPSDRRKYQYYSENGKFYVYGGGRYYQDLSDFWILDLGGMIWEQVKDLKPDPGKNYLDNFYVFPSKDEIMVLGNYHSTSVIFKYDLEENSWTEGDVIPNTPEYNAGSYSKKPFVKYQDSLFLFIDSDVYSLQNRTEEKMNNHIKNLSEAGPDVTFKVEGEKFPAHKSVLSFQSSYFQNVFSSNMTESHSEIITIKGVRAKVFKVLLKYFYMEELKVDSDIAEDLFKLCHEYMIAKLKNNCEKVLIQDIRVQNVINYVQLAEQYEAEKLRKACLVFIVNNLDEVFRTQNFKDLATETLIDIYRRNF